MLFKKIIPLLCLATTAAAQTEPTDSIQNRELKTHTVKDYRTIFSEVKSLDGVQNLFIHAGKKSETIAVQDLPANIAEKNARQIFAKIPGAFVYDMDGSGNQVNIATRGLDPHRSWEYNVRQNGAITNSDMYGYPASHFSPPMEAVSHIELVRGAAALQYGAQFGGMVNYVLKTPDTARQATFENFTSAGSFGMISSYNSLGGRVGRLTYSGFYQRRVSGGYRQNARSDAQAQQLSLAFQISKNMKIAGEIGRSQYRYQLPGPLADAQFRENPRQSSRSRNFYSPDIIVPALHFDWQISPKIKLNWLTSGVFGDRSSVQFIGLADARDTISATTLQYKNRQVDIDNFNSLTSEIRVQADWNFFKKPSTLIVGSRLIANKMHRRQQGKGTTGADYDLSLVLPQFGRDLWLNTRNAAFFIENLIKITPRWQVSAGARVEKGTSKMSGYIGYLPDDEVPTEVRHAFPLLGGSTQFQISQKIQAYGGWSQAYRPVIFADLVPPTPLDRTDKNLKNALGHNLEAGVRGKAAGGKLSFDLTFFEILYKNRLGTVVTTEPDGSTVLLKTNIGDSRTRGIEMYVEQKLLGRREWRISAFSSSSFFDGKYLRGSVRSGSENVSIAGKRLETVPRWISRNGLQAAFRTVSAVLQYSFVDESFSDAMNTVVPNASGSAGIVPAYGLWDFNFSLRVGSRVVVRGGVSNLFDFQYFTKRPAGYPGAGVWSSDGRGFVASVGFRL